MEILGKVIQILGAEFNEAPPSYGAFHLIMASLVIITTVLISIKFKNVSEKTFF